ncbi:MAG TPA: response regulator, partial [Flavobacterium sp.]|nr:response regulator [Flavobacterium sp.]
MIKAIAIDDEPLALTIIEHLCKTASNLSLLQTFTDQDEAIDYLSKHSIDILFLDIQMPQKNGIDFYKSLPIEKKPAVIFTTAYQEYAIDGFEVNAIDYLLKPIDQNRFEKAIEKALWWFQKEDVNPLENSITIRADYKNNNIILEDIQYIEGL